MQDRREFLLLTVLALCAASFMAEPASAALGEDAGVVSGESARLKAGLKVVAGAGYSIHELQTPANTTIREFASPSGVVFAVTWQGPFKPDLRQLFGRYFDIYTRAPRSAGSTRARMAIDLQDLVVRSGGHMRSYSGVAYVPGLMPTGVTAGDLQ